MKGKEDADLISAGVLYRFLSDASSVTTDRRTSAPVRSDLSSPHHITFS